MVTTEEGFWEACPSAGAIMRYVAKPPELKGITWEFGKAIIRPGHTTALFICAVHKKGHQELWLARRRTTMQAGRCSIRPYLKRDRELITC